MAHFAKINDNNIVESILVISNENLGDSDFPESEPLGQAFLEEIGNSGHWLQTSYNNNFRQRYAGIGYTYNTEMDAFITPKPYPSWTLDTDGNWQPPYEMPTDSLFYEWDEDSQQWVKYT
tara:strand:- start:452 stop:811 length:360 start_codon:yes stop_codon:yes gene_type:complete